MPYPENWSQLQKDAFTWYYGFSQFIATAAIMLNSKYYTLLLSAFPIQIAALLMTCVRKSIMTSVGWHVFYLISLILAFVTTVDDFRGLAETLLLGVPLYCLRRYGRVSKYLLWGAVSVILPLAVELD